MRIQDCAIKELPSNAGVESVQPVDLDWKSAIITKPVTTRINNEVIVLTPGCIVCNCDNLEFEEFKCD